ncbi:transposase [Xanthomonas bromi]|nr:transposase [Xanthomonas bromi]
MANALKQAELGTAVGEVCWKMGIADATFYVWRKKYGGLGPSELKRLWLPEEENRKLKQLVADLKPDKAMLQEVVTKKTKPCPATHLGRSAPRALCGQRAACTADLGDVALCVLLQGQVARLQRHSSLDARNRPDARALRS